MFSLGVMASGIGPALGQPFPNKPIRMVTAEPGGGLDYAARLVSQELTSRLGQQVITDNRGAASGAIAGETVARAAPDGYTLIFYGPPLWLLPFMRTNLRYDPLKDFVPITLAVSTPNLIVVHPSVQVESVKELIAFAKGKPGALNYASSGPGTPYHMAGELFKAMTGTDIVHVPHRASGEARTSVMGGHTQMMMDAIATMAPTVQSGDVRALATTGQKRSSVLPDVPTVAESGVPGYEATIWLGVMAPKGTPQPIVDRLNAEINKVLNRPDVRDAWAKQGVEPLVMSPAEFDTYLRADIEKWGKVVKDAGVKVQ
jgi:tripartite-type tricarboxylate transporter receptor subunit TctC